MKTFFCYVAVLLCFASCNVEGTENENQVLKIVPIESYTMPSSFVRGQRYIVKVKYQRPTSCYNFNANYLNVVDKTITIAIQLLAKETEACKQDIPPLSEAEFYFAPTVAGIYTFKFYKSTTNTGTDVFETKEVTVTEPVVN